MLWSTGFLLLLSAGYDSYRHLHGILAGWHRPQCGIEGNRTVVCWHRPKCKTVWNRTGAGWHRPQCRTEENRTGAGLNRPQCDIEGNRTVVCWHRPKCETVWNRTGAGWHRPQGAASMERETSNTAFIQEASFHEIRTVTEVWNASRISPKRIPEGLLTQALRI